MEHILHKEFSRRNVCMTELLPGRREEIILCLFDLSPGPEVSYDESFHEASTSVRQTFLSVKSPMHCAGTIIQLDDNRKEMFILTSANCLLSRKSSEGLLSGKQSKNNVCRGSFLDKRKKWAHVLCFLSALIKCKNFLTLFELQVSANDSQMSSRTLVERERICTSELARNCEAENVFFLVGQIRKLWNCEEISK